MSLSFSASAKALASARTYSVESFYLKETLNGGWKGSFVIRSPVYSRPFSLVDMLLVARSSGFFGDMGVTLSMAIDEGDGAGSVRYWPSIITKVTPQETEDIKQKEAVIEIMDPVSYMADRPIWGCYREPSIGEAVGGALCLAIGGDGRPGLKPAPAENQPSVVIVEQVRSTLSDIPYVIAAGHSLKDWLDDILGRLGIRYELSGSEEGVVTLTLLDGMPEGDSLDLALASREDWESSTGSVGGSGDGNLLRIDTAPPGPSTSSWVADDIEDGRFQRVGNGSVGGILRVPGLSADESELRATFPANRAYLDQLKAVIKTRFASASPGRPVKLGSTIVEVEDRLWQIESVEHSFRRPVYSNTLTLMRGNKSWHPLLPRERPATVVGGVVRNDNYSPDERVTQDTLGRVSVFFPFLPDDPALTAAQDSARRDSNYDGDFTFDDFTEDEVKKFAGETTADQLRAEGEKYDDGEFDDPFSGVANDDLSTEDAKTRQDLIDKRQEIERFRAYLALVEEKERDLNEDGYLTTLDSALATGDDQVLSDFLEKNGEEGLKTALTEYEETDEVPSTFLGLKVGTGNGEVDPETVKERLDGYAAYVAAQKTLDDEKKDLGNWPPLLPLRMLKFDAGSSHGFLLRPRQSDACRVVVHNPMSADILGFINRNDRRLHYSFTNSEFGFFAEHDQSASWTGFSFTEVRYYARNEFLIAVGEQAYDHRRPNSYVAIEEAKKQEFEEARFRGEDVTDSDGKLLNPEGDGTGDGFAVQVSEERADLGEEDGKDRDGEDGGRKGGAISEGASLDDGSGDG